ncbi:CIC11C00000004873 [Sungouiella intermedia]|uniref:CIC11C00000004873 n=1 Tax=Sungouiella intermedia TaxID=45354 RepID=A0A1L0GEP6_9ASCO|nr:CIC11C00000004873 [[Candida] intermedia]
MAMADRRPLGIPVASTHASPTYNANSSMKLTISDLKGSYPENDITSFNSDKSLSPDLSPTLRSISPDSLMNSAQGLVKKLTASVSSRDSTPPAANTLASASNYFPKATIAGPILGKKPKISTRVPIATGISTTIPVTGEKPKPDQEGDASLEDDVLYAIFLILYEKDAEGAGMTVKQICDILIERHPDMAQLSSKTSNLVSAKLNAYVKRVEKGDSNLKYALSREWADALPKRMVYVYRGLLAKDFHVHVKNAMDVQKLQGNLKFMQLGSTFTTDSFEAAKQSALLKQRRQTMFDLGSTRPTFLESPIDRSNLFVPYSSAPVAASFSSLHEGDRSKNDDDDDEPEQDHASAAPTPTTTSVKKLANDSDFDFDDLEVFNDTDDDASDFTIETMKKNGKRSKSMSYLSTTKKTKFLTAAAAAPRAPKTPCSHSANAAAAGAALHAAALKAISGTSSGHSSQSSSGSTSPKSQRNWATVVRSGFLTQEIGAPEDLNLSDLDKFFS